MKEITMSNCKQQECELVLNTHWDELSEYDKAIEKLSNGPIWRCYKTVVLDDIVDYETYMHHYYDYEFPEDKQLMTYTNTFSEFANSEVACEWILKEIR